MRWFGYKKEETKIAHEDEDQKDREEYIAELEDELTGEYTDIITIHLDDDYNAFYKQIALNFMLKNGYVCVQNDSCCSRYAHHYDLTFVKKEFVDFFKI